MKKRPLEVEMVVVIDQETLASVSPVGVRFSDDVCQLHLSFSSIHQKTPYI